MQKRPWEIWIDTGGTFTDCIAIHNDHQTIRLKIPSSGKLQGLIKSNQYGRLELMHNWPQIGDIFKDYYAKVEGQNEEYRIVETDLKQHTLKLNSDPGEVKGKRIELYSSEEVPVLACRLITKTNLNEQLPPIRMRLGSTKGTNAVLERKGDRVALITDVGHQDLLRIGNQQRPDLFALEVMRGKPYFDSTFEVSARTSADGAIQQDIRPPEIKRLANQITRKKIYSVAVALLHSGKNSSIENSIVKMLHDEGIPYVSASSSMSSDIGIIERAQTTVINAYLSRIIQDYVDGVASKLESGSLLIMTSAGGLNRHSHFLPKDSLLSGPAGGVVGCAVTAERHGLRNILSFDMGGTSTDVSRYDGKFDYKYTLDIGDVSINTPSLNIETVAAGGGSICKIEGQKMSVGPESAGSSPGPACYGNGGPLTITDINLLLGRVHEDNFNIPIDTLAAESAFERILAKIDNYESKENILLGFLDIANEKMAEAIKRISVSKGYDPSTYTLLSFGGAGGQHACDLAKHLEMQSILAPYNAGILSAVGIGTSEVERFASRQVLSDLELVQDQLDLWFSTLLKLAHTDLISEGVNAENIYTKKKSVFLRYIGQEESIEVEYVKKGLRNEFQSKYDEVYGHWHPEKKIEVVSLRIIAAEKTMHQLSISADTDPVKSNELKTTKCFISDHWEEVILLEWESLQIGTKIEGPALILSQNSTVYVHPDWIAEVKEGLDLFLFQTKESRKSAPTSRTEFAELELYTNRFKSVADNMGATLQRTAFSVNVKDRMDFSCAVLDSNGYLVANAPHIPVHLGSLGICTREVLKFAAIKEGDVIITNHPAYGGSHLPDVTMIAGVFHNQEIIGYVANRAHHAEIGGKTPGSMPADAVSLGEEGVLIKPTYLIRDGIQRWDEIEQLLKSGPFPSRAVQDNLADLKGALASIRNGIEGLKSLCTMHGSTQVKHYMNKLQEYSADDVLEAFNRLPEAEWKANEQLDDGSPICVSIQLNNNEIIFDFKDSAQVHPGNLNATTAIVHSAVMYVLRLLISKSLPLNEGLMRYVKVKIPEGMLNPVFAEDPLKAPAVVGGNTETSQRIVDTLLKAFKVVACSQGTMNNLIFGNDKFGFYETIGGGVGASQGCDGADAVHQHMTNTKITDPEILEHRYPVSLRRMQIRKDSGGPGKRKGGDGIVREIEFHEKMIFTVLSQHRKEQPYGINGGKPGKCGVQYLIRSTGELVELEGIRTIEVNRGDRIVVETPGGGGYGTPEKESN